MSGVVQKRVREDPAGPSPTLERWHEKLRLAAQRREISQRRSARRTIVVKHTTQATDDKRQQLEDKLASAAANRQQRLQAVVGRAAERHHAVQARAAALKDRQGQLAAQLEAHLQQAEAARSARLAETSARAGQQFARVAAAVAEQKLRTAMKAARRKQEALARLERAERHRQEVLQAMLAAAQAKHSREGFLPREAARREQLRRRSSSRKLQAAWRAFCTQRQTTRALAQAFVETGVPFTVPLEQRVVGPQHQAEPPTHASRAAAPATPRGLSAEPTPAGTPDPCGSPTSIVRSRYDGRLASANSVPQTPHTTPNRTPAPSVAGSPTASLARWLPAEAAMGSMCRPVASSAEPLQAAAAASAMPPLRSIASAAPAAAQDAPDPGAGTFERLAAALSAPATLAAAQALLERLELRVIVKGVSSGCCAGLLRRLFPRVPPGRALERYPPRIFLCAYMVLAHPDVVFNTKGEREAALTSAGLDMLIAFESLLAKLAQAPVQQAGSSPAGAADASSAVEEEAEEIAGQGEASALAAPLADMLQRFDEAWVAYLEQFVAWKSADAAGLETELIRVAVELERSRISKTARSITPRASRLRSPEDLQAIAAAVDHDLQLIGERVRRLTGAQGAARLEAALAAARAAAALEQREAAAAAAAASDAEPASPQASAALARSPSQSPIKKAQRSSGKFVGESSTPTPAVATPEVHASLSRSSSSMSVGSSSSLAAALSAAVDMDAALSQQGNLALMWQLLYEPQWQLPTAELDATWADAMGHTDPMREAPPSPDALAAAANPHQVAQLVQQRVKRIAERAFWDTVQERLAGGGGGEGGQQGVASAAGQVAELLSGLGAQLAEVLPGSAAQEVSARLEGQALLRELLPSSSVGLSMPALFGLLEWCAGLLTQYGAPARDGTAAAGQALVQQQLSAAAGDAAAVVAVAVRALRLLTVQLKMLRVDAANAHLRALSSQLHSEGAAAWATGKFEAMLGSPESYPDAEQLGAWLPHTRAWLAGASGQLPQVEQLAALLPRSRSGGTAAASQQVSPGHQVLPQLRAGLRSSVGSAAGAAAAAAQWQQLRLQAPVEARSWQGLVRLGLVQLVSGEGTIGRLPLPEILRLDAARLHAAQGDYQRLLVLTICLLLVRQGTPASSDTDLATAKRRLTALLADPGMRLPDLAAEVARLSGGEQSAAQERAVQESIHRMLSRSGGAMKALVSGITTALMVLLFLGPDSTCAQEQAALALRRCGAGDLAHEAAQLAQQLAGVAAVCESVCCQWYRSLSADLL